MTFIVKGSNDNAQYLRENMYLNLFSLRIPTYLFLLILAAIQGPSNEPPVNFYSIYLVCPTSFIGTQKNMIYIEI